MTTAGTLENPGVSAEPGRALSAVKTAHRAVEPSPAELAYENWCRRRENGEAVSVHSFCARFPHFKTSLARLLDAHLHAEEFFANEAAIAWPEAGQSFLNFKLILELGRGAFARVYLAQESEVGDRLVAVKIAWRGGSEADVLGRNPHPNIVPVLSIREDSASNLTAICMPYLGSATLCDVLDQVNVQTRADARARILLDVASKLRYPLDASAAARDADAVLRHGSYLDGIRNLGAKLADALAYLHERGIYHFDLKPSNVLLNPRGEPFLLDFNLSADEREVQKRLGGTMPYMSPEQLRATQAPAGSAAPALDARSDLFSLGVILYELATGEHPFGPWSLDLKSPELARHLADGHEQGARPPHEVNPQIEPAFSRLIQQCLALDAKDRPASAAEIAKTLRKDLAPLGRAKRLLARHPGLVLAIALGLGALGVGVYALAAGRAPIHERQIDRAERMYREQRFDESLDYFNAALRNNPDHADALFGRGRTHLKLHQYNQALHDFQQAEKKSPHGRNLACMGYGLNLVGQPLNAAECYRCAIKADYATPEVLNNLAYCLLRSNEPRLAQIQLDEALRQNPGLQAAYHNRGLAVLRIHQAAVLNPRSKDRKRAYLQLVAAIDDMNQAIQIGPASAGLFLDAATLCAVAAQVEERWSRHAIAHLASAVNRGGNPRRLADRTFAILRSDKDYQVLVERAAKLAPPTQQTATADSTVGRLVDPVKD